jgi:D-alanine-D-alanine ligase
VDSSSWSASLDAAIEANSRDIAVLLVFDRPWRETERPGLARTHFGDRCVSDEALEVIISVFRDAGLYVELFEGERPFIEALTSGYLRSLERSITIAYNGIGWGIGANAFMAGRKALVPLLADAFGGVPFNADGYACALTVNKFHSFLVFRGLGIAVPDTWQYDERLGWIGPQPPAGTRVIAKSTYEASSVGVSHDSVFVIEEGSDEKLRDLARSIGQPITVQRFIIGPEVCVPVMSKRKLVVAPPMKALVSGHTESEGLNIMTLEDVLRPDGFTHQRFEADERLIRTLTETSHRLFELLDLRGLARFDYRIDERGVPWLFDVAIEPGIGASSSAFRGFRELGFDHPSFLRAVLATSLEDWGAIQVND